MKRHYYFFSISGALGVILGAFSAHYLKALVKSGHLNAEILEAFKTGVLYQLIHTLFLGIVLTLSKENFSKYLKLSAILVEIGIILFSGSIYLLTLGKLFSLNFLNFFGAVTPVGGILLILSWFMLFLHLHHKFGKKIEK